MGPFLLVPVPEFNPLYLMFFSPDPCVFDSLLSFVNQLGLEPLCHTNLTRTFSVQNPVFWFQQMPSKSAFFRHNFVHELVLWNGQTIDIFRFANRCLDVQFITALSRFPISPLTYWISCQAYRWPVKFMNVWSLGSASVWEPLFGVNWVNRIIFVSQSLCSEVIVRC